MLFDDFALQPVYEHLLEDKKGAVLRILYSENIEKREIRENLLELRSTAVGKVNCSNFSFYIAKEC